MVFSGGATEKQSGTGFRAAARALCDNRADSAMTVTFTPYLVHFAYVLMFGAFVARDILWLRGLLACAQVSLGTYALVIHVPPIAGWNFLFMCINVGWIVKILRERRAVTLPADLAPWHRQCFSPLTAGEFLRLWQRGRREWLPDGTRLAADGQPPDALYFLLAGTARVLRDGHFVCDLVPGQMVGEMSVITGEPANADVWTKGDTEVISWPMADVIDLRESQPAVWGRFQSVIGRDLVEKVIRGEAFSRAT